MTMSLHHQPAHTVSSNQMAHCTQTYTAAVIIKVEFGKFGNRISARSEDGGSDYTF